MLSLYVFSVVFYVLIVVVMWLMYVDVVDYFEWQIGWCFIGMVFVIIGFLLKIGLVLGSVGFLWLLVGFFGYDIQLFGVFNVIDGYCFVFSFGVGVLFVVCMFCLLGNKLDKQIMLCMVDELVQCCVKVGVFMDDDVVGLIVVFVVV